MLIKNLFPKRIAMTAELEHQKSLFTIDAHLAAKHILEMLITRTLSGNLRQSYSMTIADIGNSMHGRFDPRYISLGCDIAYSRIMHNPSVRVAEACGLQHLDPGKVIEHIKLELERLAHATSWKETLESAS